MVPFTITADGASPGTHHIGLVLTSLSPPITRQVSITLHVGDSGFSAFINPKSAQVISGGNEVDVAASLSAGECFHDSNVQVDTEAPAGIVLTPISQTLTGPAFSSVHFKVSAAGSVQSGTYRVAFKFHSDSSGQTIQNLDVVVAEGPGFSIAVNPDSLSLQPQQSATISVSLAGKNGFAQSVNVKAPRLDAASFAPQTFSLKPGASKEVTVRSKPGATPQTLQAAFEGSAPGFASQHALLTINILPGPPPPPISNPTIVLVSPPAVATGTRTGLVLIAGTRFQPDATVFSDSEFLVVERTTVTSSTTAEISLTVKDETPPGPYELKLKNPDGSTTEKGGIVRVDSSSSVAATFGVTTAAIVYPRDGVLVDYSEPIFPKALLAITGTGSVTGTWQLDGFAFDQFTVSGQGGLPVQIETQVPLPTSYEGEHSLQIVITAPASLLSPVVTFLQSTDSQSQLHLLAPPEAARIGNEIPKFRWTLVPGASGYMVEVEIKSGESLSRYRMAQSEWEPAPEQLREWGAGIHRWRVHAVFPGDVIGEPTEWRTFEVASDVSQFFERSEKKYRLNAAVFASDLSGSHLFSDQQLNRTGETFTQSAPDKHQDWSLKTTGNLNGLSGTEPGRIDNVNLQLAAQGDINNGNFSEKFTTDLSRLLNLQTSNQQARQNRNWLLETEKVGGLIQPKITVGYATPEALDEAQILTSGFTKGGLEASIQSGIGVASYFESFEDGTSGVQSGELEPRQKLRVESFQLPETIPRISLSIIGMQINTSTTSSEPADDGKLFGVLAKASLFADNSLSFEFAHSDFDPARETPANQKRSGLTYRLGLDGMQKGWAYQFSVIQIGDHFVNPANPSITTGGRPGRSTASATASRSFGRHSLSLSYGHSLSGNISGETKPGASENSFTGSYSALITSRISLSASTAFTKDHEDADSSTSLPESNRSQTGINVAATETMGELHFSESTSYQRTKDRANPLSDQTAKNFNATISGTALKKFNMSALIAGTQMDTGPALGSTTNWTFSFQGSFPISPLNLTLQPRLSWNRTSNQVLHQHFQTKLMEGLLTWAPVGWLAFQAVVDRVVSPVRSVLSFDEPATEPESLAVYRYTGSMTIRWGKAAGALARK